MNTSVRKVVLAPDLVGLAFFDPACYRVLELWRDGKIEPVLNRDLMLVYLKLLRSLGLEGHLIRRWTWWFNSPAKCFFVEAPVPPGSAVMLCAALAGEAKAEYVVGGRHSTGGQSEAGDQIRWIQAAPFGALYGG